MMDMRERYLRDALFRQLVDQMCYCIEQLQATPTEVREAAMLAQLMYEERNPRPIVFTMDDVKKGKV